jgi:hypothetical protein
LNQSDKRSTIKGLRFQSPVLDGLDGQMRLIQSCGGPMQPTKLFADGERPDDDPYAPPRAGTNPEVDEKETDQVGNQRKEHLRRESCIRVAGILGLILAGYAVLTFVLVPLSELYDPESLGEEGIVPWMFQRWVARSICDILIAVLAFVTSWGLLIYETGGGGL